MEDEVTTPATPAQTDTGASGEQTSQVVTPPVVETPAAPAAETPAAPEAAPETPAEIQDFTVPEGMELDPSLSDALKAFAKENGLTQEKAQQVADLGVRMLQTQQDGFEALKAQWVEEAKTDKEYGGEKFAENLAVATKAIEQFATPEFKQFLNESGLGNHPEMIRAWNKVGKAISEDKVITGGVPTGADVPPEKRLYPTMN